MRKVVVSAFDADTHPDVVRPLEVRAHFAETSRPLGQYLELVPSCLSHDVEHPPNEILRHEFVKGVTHGVYEDQSRFPPA